MPTARNRYMLTGSERVESALSRAAVRWPEDRDRPTRLLLRLIEVGDSALESSARAGIERRLDAIRATSGSLTGIYPVGYLRDLRTDWPE